MRQLVRQLASLPGLRGISSLRDATPRLLMLAGLLSVAALVLVDGDPTGTAICIGLASTLLVAGFVDWSALAEARRREQAVLSVAGERIGRVHARLLGIIQTVFDVRSEKPANIARTSCTAYEGERTSSPHRQQIPSTWFSDIFGFSQTAPADNGGTAASS